MVVALLAVVAVSAALILHWVRNISEDDIAGAVMEASDIDAGGVAVNSSFVLNFDDAVGSAAVRRCLEVEPEIELGLHQGASRQQVLVVPAQPLDEDTLYTFKLSMDDAGMCWAFQTSADVKVVSFTPDDHSSLEPDGQISFTLDRLLYADLGCISDYFSITPEIGGSFEQEGRILRFKADEEFSPGTVYTVTLKSGLPFNDTAISLADSVSFSFESRPSSANWSLVGENLYLSGQQPLFHIKSDPNFDLPDKAQIQLFSFNKDNYVRLLTDIVKNHPAWSESFACLSGCDTARGAMAASAEITLGSGGSFTLPDQPQDGCYLLRVSLGGVSRDLPFMVSRMAAAVLPHDDDLLLWLHESKTGANITQARVKDAISGKTAVSDSSGTALLEDVGDAAVCVVEAGRSSLIWPVWQCGPAQDGSWLWRYLYLSQERYESGDELYFWGLVQPRDGSALEYDRVTVYLFDEDGETVSRQFCALDGGIFHDSIILPLLPAGLYRLAIWQSGHELVGKDFALGGADLPAAATAAEQSGAILLDSTVYHIGESFAASCSSDAEDYLFMMSDSDHLTWQETPFGLYADAFQPQNMLDSYCSALCYTNGSYTFSGSAPLYLDYEDHRLSIELTPGEDYSYSLQVSDSSGTPLPGTQVAVSVCVGNGLQVSPCDAIFQDYSCDGFGESEVSASPASAGTKGCLYFAALKTDENGKADFDINSLTSSEDCCLLIQAIYAGDRILAGHEQQQIDLPYAMPDETSDDAVAKRVSGFSALHLDGDVFYGEGGDTLMIAAGTEQARCLYLLGNALAGEDDVAAAAAACVLSGFSGGMMEELLSGCGFDLSVYQGSDGAVNESFEASVLMALLKPQGISSHALIRFFSDRIASCDTDDEYAACLAALAALGRPQLNDVRMLAEDGPGFNGQCWLAVAAAICGDSSAACYIKDQPQDAWDWAVYGLALAYCGEREQSLQALENAYASGDCYLSGLYNTAAAGLLLGDAGSLTNYRQLRLSDRSQQSSYNISYTVDGVGYQNSFTSDSKYQLPLKGFDGTLRIENADGVGFCCFSVSDAEYEYWENAYWEEPFWEEEDW